MRLRNYILHLRPKSWPVVAGHMTVGFLCVGDIAWTPLLLTRLVLGVLCWIPFLNGGTLALNSFYDNDEGDVGYLNNPPSIPRYLHIFSYLLMIIGLAVAAGISRLFFLVYAVCLVLSILYSVPPFRLKSKPGIDAVINSFGYGTATFLAGYAIHNVQMTRETVVISLFYFFLFGAFYPLTQIYQHEEDMAKGDVTLTGFFGPRNVLVVSCIGVLISFGIYFAYMPRHGIHILGGLVYLSGLAWLGLLVHWISGFARYPHKKGMYRALKIWGFTDISMILACNPMLFGFLSRMLQ